MNSSLNTHDIQNLLVVKFSLPTLRSPKSDRSSFVTPDDAPLLHLATTNTNTSTQRVEVLMSAPAKL